MKTYKVKARVDGADYYEDLFTVTAENSEQAKILVLERYMKKGIDDGAPSFGMDMGVLFGKEDWTDERQATREKDGGLKKKVLKKLIEDVQKERTTRLEYCVPFTDADTADWAERNFDRIVRHESAEETSFILQSLDATAVKMEGEARVVSAHYGRDHEDE